jgi:hypothetical protein
MSGYFDLLRRVRCNVLQIYIVGSRQLFVDSESPRQPGVGLSNVKLPGNARCADLV